MSKEHKMDAGTQAHTKADVDGCTTLKALLVDPDDPLRRYASKCLVSAGIKTLEAASATEAVHRLAKDRPDIVVMETALPGGEGIALIRHISLFTQLSVLVLSEQTDDDAKVSALEAGADDYLVKPFGCRELAARVRAILRRSTPHPESVSWFIEAGGLQLNARTRCIRRVGQAVGLTPIETALLACLMARPDHLLYHQDLQQAIWQTGHGGDMASLHVHIGNLRRKIEPDPTHPRHILCEHGVGYRFLP